MKKILIFLVCILLANVGFARDVNSGIISNRRGFIMQALNNGALGYICPKYSLCENDCRMGQFVYFDFNFDFVDNQMFSIPKDCRFYADGIYRYQNREGQYKTVRKIKLISK